MNCTLPCENNYTGDDVDDDDDDELMMMVLMMMRMMVIPMMMMMMAVMMVKALPLCVCNQYNVSGNMTRAPPCGVTCTLTPMCSCATPFPTLITRTPFVPLHVLQQPHEPPLGMSCLPQCSSCATPFPPVFTRTPVWHSLAPSIQCYVGLPPVFFLFRPNSSST